MLQTEDSFAQPRHVSGAAVLRSWRCWGPRVYRPSRKSRRLAESSVLRPKNCETAIYAEGEFPVVPSSSLFRLNGPLSAHKSTAYASAGVSPRAAFSSHVLCRLSLCQTHDARLPNLEFFFSSWEIEDYFWLHMDSSVEEAVGSSVGNLWKISDSRNRSPKLLYCQLRSRILTEPIFGGEREACCLSPPSSWGPREKICPFLIFRRARSTWYQCTVRSTNDVLHVIASITKQVVAWAIEKLVRSP